MLYRVHLAWAGFKLTTLVVIGTDCTGSCKSNYHLIMTTTAPVNVNQYRYTCTINIYCPSFLPNHSKTTDDSTFQHDDDFVPYLIFINSTLNSNALYLNTSFTGMSNIFHRPILKLNLVFLHFLWNSMIFHNKSSVNSYPPVTK